jgi:hypothetical protein
MNGRTRIVFAVMVAALLSALTAGTALGAFPYNRTGGSLTDYKDFFLTTEAPPDLSGNEQWMYSATPEATPPTDPFNIELGGVRGAHVVDDADAPATAWKTTLGRPDVLIAVHDSGIKWNDAGAMNNLRFKIHLNRGELVEPNQQRPTNLVNGSACPGTPAAPGVYDVNNDSVLNLRDYACDDRVNVTDPRRAGPGGMLTPQDVLIAFSNGDDQDGNGFVDDIVGWDFVDDDNDPYDDVKYGHGTGEARDSNAEAANGEDGVGTCPDCMVMPIRVGESFIADVNRFARGVLYSTDLGANVIQEALGTINNTRFARQAVNYAYGHGVTVIASAADEAAQHNNWPSSLPHVILVNSVTQYDTFTPQPKSYLQFNGCTNFNAKITVAIPSVSCSSDATGRGSGEAGLIYAAALNARDRGKLSNAPNCNRAVDLDGNPGLDPCVITANEVRQLMATGIIGGTPQADDVDFIPGPAPEPACGAAPTPGCTSTAASVAAVEAARPVISPLAETRSYPARGGHDQFYGYGRVNMANAVGALVRPPLGDSSVKALLPPSVEITSPEWYDQIDPSQDSFEVDGQISKRPGAGACTYRVLIAPGHYPNNTELPLGDFGEVANGSCDSPVDGQLANVDVGDLQARFPAVTDFTGSEPTPTPEVDNGRPFAAPHGFTVKVVATTAASGGAPAMSGQDHRAMWLHRDADMLPGFPRKITNNSAMTGDGESSPALADLNGDNKNELVMASADGFVHAFRRDGSELPGWPVKGDTPGFLHTGGRAFTSNEVPSVMGGAFLASVAVGDTDRNGIPEVYAADYEGKLYGWNPAGQRIFSREANIDFSGKPLASFQNVRNGPLNRTQHGFIGSPVLANIDEDRALEIVAANMDRHVYAWNPNGSAVPGFPDLVVDRSKVQSIDPTTHRIQFNPGGGYAQQGGLVDTPAIGDLDGNGTGPNAAPEIVVGSNEEYEAASDGGINADTANGSLPSLLEQAGVLSPGNTRLYMLKATGDADNNLNTPDDLRHPPTKIGIAFTELLPDIGEGITAPPIIAPVTCPSGGAGPKVGVAPNNGFGYVLNPDGTSCYGQEAGRDRVLQSDFGASPGKYDTPVLMAAGSPSFGALTPGASPSIVAPAAGAIRALDLGANEYQGGQDFSMAWNSETSAPQPGFPAEVNDLSFLTGPSIADIDGVPGEEVVAGTASFDLNAFSAAGTPVAGWPKLTGDWTIANPTIGSFGTLDAGPGATNEGKAVIGLTRSGYILAYDTDAGACTASSWPRFHHDNANSGDYRRDAVLPGKPMNPTLPNQTTMQLVAPGDDLMCGTAAKYEVATSNAPIDENNFDAATQLSGAPAPSAAGATQSFPIPENALRYLAIRAVDEQDNVGRVGTFDRGAPPVGDADNDGDLDNADNCPNDFNPDQSNQDGDALGDACDPDDDGDGVNDTADNCPIDANPDQADNDHDGIGNACDPVPGPTPGGNPPVSGPCATERRGTGGNDSLTGTEGGDRIVGLRGNDNIRGLGGDDCLLGNKGSDRVNGGAGADQISGGNHRDRITGGPGADTIRGGNAGDVIKAKDGEADTVDCGGGTDRVKADKQDKLVSCEITGKRAKKSKRR